MGLTSACTLFVCTSCRPPGCPREPEEQRPGFLLFHRLARLIDEGYVSHEIELKAAECLSLCPRPCGIALSSPGSWTYLFGDQDPNQSPEEILDCVSSYIEKPAGQLARASRPSGLRSTILGRIPPPSFLSNK